MNKSSALTAAALTAAGVVLSAGAAHAATPRITSHDQLRASITAAAAAMTPDQVTAQLGGPAGQQVTAALATPETIGNPIGKAV